MQGLIESEVPTGSSAGSPDRSRGWPLVLALAVHARQQATGAPHGLTAALQGERVVTLGLPPFVPSDAARLQELRMDGIADFRLD